MNRLPPHSIDSEEAFLGSILLDGTIAEFTTLKSSDFYSERNAYVFESCQSLKDKKVSINQITLAYELAACEHLEDCGGAAYLSHLIDSCPTSLDWQYYEQIIKKLSAKRKLIEISDQIASLGYDLDVDVDKGLAKADELLLNLRKEASSTEIVTPEMRAEQALAHYIELKNKAGGIAVPTGLADVDHYLGGGGYPGELILIGGRAGIGKTTIAKTIANNIGSRGEKVLYFTCEMPNQSLTDRDIAGYLGKPIDVIRHGDYDNSDRGLFDKIIGEGIEYITQTQVYHVDGLISTERVRQTSLQMKQRYGLSAIVVDYLGLLVDEYGRTDAQRISYISRNLKQIAIQLDVPLFSPVQLNRNLESREDKRPQLYDLRDSGSLEQDADVVLLMYRENYYKQTQDNTAEVIIAKKRQGRANIKVKIYFDEKHQRYCNLQRGF